MNIIEELLYQLDGWIELQDYEDKDKVKSVINQMINNNVKISDASDYCRIVQAPEAAVDAYKRFLMYIQQQEQENTDYQAGSVVGDNDLRDSIEMLDAKLDTIIAMIERLG